MSDRIRTRVIGHIAPRYQGEPRSRREIVERLDPPAIVNRVRALAACTFLPASRDKQFARDMAIIVNAGCPLTQKQVEHVNRLARKYRRQMPRDQLPTDAE